MYAVQGCKLLYHNGALVKQLNKKNYLAMIDDFDAS